MDDAGQKDEATVQVQSRLALGEINTIEEAEAKAQAVRPIMKVKSALKDTLARLHPEAQHKERKTNV